MDGENPPAQDEPVVEQFVQRNPVSNKNLGSDDKFSDMIIEFLDKNADKMIYNDNISTRTVLGPYRKISPNQDKYLGYDLAKPNALKRV